MKKTCKSFSLLLLTLPLALLAEEDHVPVGDRPQTDISLVPQEISCLPVPEQALLAEAEESEESAAWGWFFDRSPSSYFNSYHLIQKFSPEHTTVELEDGTAWKIGHYDQYEVQCWKSSDLVVVTQNHRWFSKYPYRILNPKRGTSIEASLFLGPITNGPYTRYINHINFSNNLIVLNDNTNWEVCPSDTETFQKWLVNDSVVIGFNTGWQSSYEGLIINVATNDFIRAKQYH